MNKREFLERQNNYLKRFRETAVICIPPRFSLITRLYETKKPIGIIALAKSQGVSVSLAMKHLAVIEEVRLVERIKSESFIITEEGISFYEWCIESMENS